MKRRLFLLVALTLFFSMAFLPAVEVGNTIPIQIQTLDASENIVTGTFTFQINISNSASCSPVLYSNTTTKTTDSRGIVTYTLEDVNLDFNEQYWFCYYRNGVLKETVKASRVPYAFRARNVTSSGIAADSNLNLGGYNLTGGSFFGNLDASYIQNAPWLTSASGGVIGTGTSGYLPMWNGTSSLNNSAIYQNGSNVGIGTSTPTRLLHLNGTQPEFQLTDSDSNKSWHMGTMSNVFQIVETGVAAVMTFYPGGKVGIGTSTPTEKLDIESGAIRVGYSADTYDELITFWRNNIQVGAITNYNNEILLASRNNKNLYLFDDAGNGITLEDGGNVGVGTTNPAYTLDVNGSDPVLRVYATVNSRGIIIYPSNGDIESDNVDLYLNRYNSDDVLLANGGGKVGIGTATPSTTLDVRGTINASGMIYYNNGTPISGGSNYWGSNGSNIYNETAYVGIGTTSPARSLHINGTSPEIQLTDTDVSKSWHIGTANSDFRIVETGVDTRMTIEAGGNVGIGTVNPLSILHTNVSLLASTPIFERSGQTSDNLFAGARILVTKTSDMGNGFGAGITYNVQDDAGVINPVGFIGAIRAGADNSGDLLFVPYEAGVGNEKMRLSSDGELGIGTTTPSALLHVNGSAPELKIQGTSAVNPAVLNITSSARTRIYMDGAGGTDTNQIAFRTGGVDKFQIEHDNTNNKLYINNGSGTEIITFLQNGNVGIGTTSPQAKLEVAGSINLSSGGNLTFASGSSKISSNATCIIVEGATATLNIC